MKELALRFPAGRESIAGLRIDPDDSPSSRLIVLHGAGSATKERSRPIMECLARQYSVSSFAIDFSGHGESSGTIRSSSLKKRVNEAEAAILKAGCDGPISIAGFSMGGHVAIQLLRTELVHSLILFYPAVYANEAADVSFGDERFTKILRTPGSWRQSDSLELLQEFAGNLLVVVGDRDEIVPREITDAIMSHAASARKKELIVIPNTPHLVLPNLLADRLRFKFVCRRIAEFLTE